MAAKKDDDDDDDGLERLWDDLDNEHSNVPVTAAESTNLETHVDRCGLRYMALLRFHRRQAQRVHRMHRQNQARLSRVSWESRISRVVIVTIVGASSPDLTSWLKKVLTVLGG